MPIQKTFTLIYVTGDETWLRNWDPDTKKSPCNGSTLAHPPKKFCTKPLAGKVMATVFGDSKGIILIDYKPAVASITPYSPDLK